MKLFAKATEKGQSMTEFAVSLTLLLMLLAVAVDGGRVFTSFIAVRDAAEEGALHGAYNPSDSAGIESRARTTSSNPVNLSDTGTVSVSSTVVGSACAGNTVEVTVTYTITMSMPFLGAVIGTQTFPLSATAITTIITPAC